MFNQQGFEEDAIIEMSDTNEIIPQNLFGDFQACKLKY